MITDRATPVLPNSTTRYHFIDALRVYTFLLLIVFHTGLVFCRWRWHIEAESHSSGIAHFQQFLTQWRIPLLFLVSGMGVAILIAKGTWTDFLENRLRRIAVPFVTSLLVIIPFQIFLERYWQGYDTAVLLDTPAFVAKGYQAAGHYSHHHLWYLFELWNICLFGLPFIWFLHRSRLFENAKGFAVGCLLVSLFALAKTLTFNAIYEHLAFFTLGFCLAKWTVSFAWLAKQSKVLLLTGVLTYASLVLIFWQGEYSNNPLTVRNASMVTKLIFRLLTQLNLLVWVLGLTGLAARYLTKSSRLVKKLNDTILPMYIFHQIVLMVLAYLFADFALNSYVKIASILLLTLGITYSIALGLKAFSITRILFGLKPKGISNITKVTASTDSLVMR